MTRHILAIAALSALCVSGCDMEPPSHTSPRPAAQQPAAPAAPDAEELIQLARHAVREHGLRSPRSAQFPLPESGDYIVADLGDGTHRVMGYVDAENALGVSVREDWIVEIELEGSQVHVRHLEVGDSVIYSER